MVVAGDTLYSIAWESGHDVRELAAWNRIAPPYLIRPGQKLRVRPSYGAKERAGNTSGARKKPNGPHIVARGESLYGIARDADVEVHDLAAWNDLSPPYTLEIGQKLRLTPDKKSQREAVAAGPRDSGASAKESGQARSKPPASSQSGSKNPASAGRSQTTVQWSWPADGALLERYRADGRSRGIEIGGARGALVHAAAGGHVVYQGSGLRGYGNLIIIKHNTDYLSAYAHCDRTYVREGDVVKSRQKLAEMGSSGTDRVKLHFEIRHRGRPVDPLDHLPRK